MNEKEYRASEGISRSELWQIRESPEKFKYYREHPKASSPAQIFGSAVHKLILEPDGFDGEFVLAPNIDRRTKDGKAAYNAFLDGLDGRDIISQADYTKALSMASRALETPYIKALLSQGAKEYPLWWNDDITGELCKVRLDCLTEVQGQLYIVDYKTAADASTDSFMRVAVKYGYDFQAAMYCEAVYKTTGRKANFVFVVQEKEEPYAINMLVADDYFLLRGYDIFRELIGIYHDCKESGNWWGYLGAYNVINTLKLPSYLEKVYNDNEERGEDNE